MNEEGIYLLRKHEFILNDQPIYKIGRSKKLLNRLDDYSNGSMVHLLISCDDSIIHEKKLIELFSNKYDIQLYYGSEYFLGSVDTMKQDVINYINDVMQYKGYRLISSSVLIERKNMTTLKNIPKKKQNIYTAHIDNIQAKTMTENINNDECNSIDDIADLNIEEISLDDKKILLEPISELSDIKISISSCKCGYEAKNELQLLKHQNKCKSISDIVSEIHNECICHYCKKILANKFSCDRHMLNCKKIKQIDTVNDSIKITSNKTDKRISNFSKTCKESLKEVEKHLFLIKNFIMIYESSNTKEKQIILESDEYKKHIDLILKYNPNSN